MVFKYSQSELRMLSVNNVKGVKKRDSQAKQFDTLPAQQASERSFQFHINFFFFQQNRELSLYLKAATILYAA